MSLFGLTETACFASERTAADATAMTNVSAAPSVPAATLTMGEASATVPQTGATRVIGKRDRTIADGKHVCDVDFAYADREPEDLFWNEPCAAMTVTMVDRQALERSDRWDRLDAFQQKFVEGMPGGRVLQIEGSFSASIYPIDTTGTTIEVAVAD